MKKATITLSYPVEVDGTKFKELQMRRPKVRDQINSQKKSNDPAEQEIALLVDLCEVPSEVFYEMDLSDYGKCSSQLLLFMKGQPTSESE